MPAGWIYRCAVVAAAVALVSTSADGKEISGAREVRADGIVEIRNVSGSVHVIGWDRPTVAVKGSLGPGAEDVSLSGNDYRTSVEVVPAEGEKRAGAADLTIHTPAGSRVEVGTVNADVTVSSVTGAVFVYTVHGRTQVTGQPREVEAKSLKGDIDLSVSGSRVKLNTAAGKATLTDVTGEADVSTVSGSVTVAGGRYGRGRFSTVSGDLEFAAGLGLGGAFEFTSHSGAITLRLSESIPADFVVSTRAGRLTNGLRPGDRRRRTPAEVRPGRGGRGPRRRAVDRVPSRVQPEVKRLSFSTHQEADSASIGEQAAGLSKRTRVVVSSFSGNVSLERK